MASFIAWPGHCSLMSFGAILTGVLFAAFARVANHLLEYSRSNIVFSTSQSYRIVIRTTFTLQTWSHSCSLGSEAASSKRHV
jgi:hypothetical protein